MLVTFVAIAFVFLRLRFSTQRFAIASLFLFFFSFSTRFWTDWQFFLYMFYLLLLLTRVNRYSLDTPVNSFVKVPSIVISGACCQCQELNTSLKAVQEARVLQPVEKCLRLAACVAAKIFIFIDNDFAIAIIKLIYIYLHFMTVIYPYIYLLIFFSTALVNLPDRVPKRIRLIQFHPMKLTG